MKIRLLAALVALSIGFAVPSIAQAKNMVDREVRQEIEALGMKFKEAYNKHDAAAIAALFTQDAVRVLDWRGGALFGREAIQRDFAVNFASSPPELVGNLVQMYAIGDGLAAIAEWSAGQYNGHSVKIYVRDADTWKIRMEYVASSMIPR